MNSGGRVMPKPNRLGDDISGYGFKNTLKKGDVLNGNVRILPHRNNSEGRFNPTSKYSISDEPAFIPKPNRGSYTDSGRVEVENSRQNWGYRVNERGDSNKDVGWWTVDGANFRSKLGGQEGEALDPTSKYSISDEPAFVPKPDSALGPDVVTTLEHGPGVASQPKGVLLKFINGEWIDP